MTAGRRFFASLPLRDRLPGDAVPVSSPETKALSTLALALGVPDRAIRTDPGFAEIHRPGEPFDDDVLDRRSRWVEGRLDARHEGWESPSEAADRFSRGLAGINAEHIVVGTHGMVATAWLVSVGQVRAGSEAVRFWRDLQLPDILEVDLDAICAGRREMP